MKEIHLVIINNLVELLNQHQISVDSHYLEGNLLSCSLDSTPLWLSFHAHKTKLINSILELPLILSIEEFEADSLVVKIPWVSDPMDRRSGRPSVCWVKNLLEPWFSWVATGVKIYEGRLFKEDWITMELNDQILFYNYVEGKIETVVCRIVGKILYDTFDEAYQELGYKLIPSGIKDKTADEIYQEIFGSIPIDDYQKVIIKLSLDLA